MAANPDGQVRMVDAGRAAAELAEAVAAGDGLPDLVSPVLLDAGEVLHANVDAHAWRYHAVDVACPQQGSSPLAARSASR
jgi:hypothetical protein